MLNKGAIDRVLIEKEKTIKEVVEKIQSELAGAMNGPNGEIMKGGSEDFINGLITAFRIVEKYNPNRPLKADQLIDKMNKEIKKMKSK